LVLVFSLDSGELSKIWGSQIKSRARVIGYFTYLLGRSVWGSRFDFGMLGDIDDVITHFKVLSTSLGVSTF